jgi:glycosyltransferase involved in cell wall biosynthesis
LGNPPEVSVVMPCLNEAKTVRACVEKAQTSLAAHPVCAEIIVADNGSTDGSQQIARDAGARVVDVAEKGYGAALGGGIAAARGRFIIMGDADDSYDFANLGPFVDKLREGYDLVMGNRFAGGIADGAMPPLHRYLGNPVLTGIGRLLFKSPCRDFHCGLRGFRKEAIEKLDLRTTGMEFASEMVVKATLHGLKIAEIPTTLSPAGRDRPPHLRSWRDGWRHLRFLLLYSPRWLFLYPGLLLMFAGVIVGLWLLPGPRRIGKVELDVHTLLYAAAAVLIGFQSASFAILSKVFAINEGLLPPDPKLARAFKHVTLEGGILVGLILMFAGIAGSVYAVASWGARSFGKLQPTREFRIVIPAVTSLALGCQIVLNSFFMSVLNLRRR